MLNTLLVANRGEIACRIIRSAKRMGLGTVAVYSDADTDSLAVSLADRAVAIGPAPASASYLSIPAIIDAARRSGCDALHPGYGFLSENAALVEACAEAGITFVGPDARALSVMGRKDAAKARMESAGVPVVPGYHGAEQGLSVLADAADRIGYPVLIKARAGGGGKGMRRVDSAGDFAAALDSARREASASFGDEHVLIEKYIDCPRHIEVQVFGDRHGNVVHLFERDCSLQRRHQKVIEEAPAPGMTDAVRTVMTSAAVTAARSIDYVGAGTIEFIVDGSGPLREDGFWFMEMNTRLQVEHPVTEAITGFDLVEWQLQVAAGDPLPASQAQIDIRGHAVEARLYAEDVAAGFLPASGVLHRLRFPIESTLSGATADSRRPVCAEQAVEFPAGVRVDTGVREGDQITMHYDPLLAKLIAHAPSRSQALQQLARALDDTVVLGTTSNREFLATLCRAPVVCDAAMTTHYIDTDLGALTAVDTLVQAQAEAIAAVCVANNWQSDCEPPRSLARHLGPWALWGEPVREVMLASTGSTSVSQAVSLRVSRQGDSQWCVLADRPEALPVQIDTASRSVERWVVDGSQCRVVVCGAEAAVHVQLGHRAFRFERPDARAATGAEAGDQRMLAPMPGRVTGVFCQIGDSVTAGTVLVTLEAMKMEQSLVVATDGVVESVDCAVDDQVTQGQELVRLAFE